MTPLERLTDAVNDLTRPRTIRQPYSYRDDHGTWIHNVNVVRVVSLLDQLGHTTSLERGDTSNGHAVPTSRPTGRLEALDVLLAIDVECTQLLGIYGGVERDTLPDTIRGLVGLATELDEPSLKDVASTACRWASRAMSVTGWADPAWRPDNTCPLCGDRRSLRVRGVTATEIHASCVGCGEVWTPDTIGLLAEHIRWENQDYEQEASA